MREYDTERFDLARDLYFKFMSDTVGLEEFSDEERLNLFDKAAVYSIEMTDAFFKRIDEK